jgi:signal transduction histidine kinase/ActR/RegA family two-component response regulator
MRRISRWYALAALLLVLLLGGVGWLQTRSLSLLNGSVLYEGDNLLWSFYQLDSEYLRLREQLRVLAVEPDAHKARRQTDALRERYEIFVSRISLIEPERMSQVVSGIDGQPAMLQRLRAFVAQADAIVTSGPEVLDPARCRALLAQFEPLAEPLHQLVLAANQAFGEYASHRNEAVRDTNRISIALTVFQSLLTVLLAGLLVRQLTSLERRRAELEDLAVSLQHARADAEQASRAKSAFLANMSHELRTPFNGLLGMLSLLESSPQAPEQAEQLRTARESGEHLLDILDDVLDVSRLDSGQLEIAPTPVDLARLLRDVDALMGPQARARGLTLVLDIGPGLPAWVQVDGKRLKQIVFNLVGNAIKFTERGAVQIHTGLVRRPAPAGAVDSAAPELVLSVSDTGIGMDADTLGRLFQRFSQGDSSIHRRFGGTGLGLEISRNLARLMGGDISASSEPGRGSVFTLNLPLQVLDEQMGAHPGDAHAPVAAPAAARAPSGVGNAAPSAAEAAPVGPPHGLATPTRAALQVLVCDDHPVNCKLLVALLGRLGLAARICEHGAQAVDLVRSGAWDLVLMDMHMPVMDGLAATRAIRALGPRERALVVVAVTADAFEEARRLALDAGMNDVVTKPLQLRDLRDCLLRHFPHLDLPVLPGRSVGPVYAVRTEAPALPASTAPALAEPISGA